MFKIKVMRLYHLLVTAVWMDIPLRGFPLLENHKPQRWCFIHSYVWPRLTGDIHQLTEPLSVSDQVTILRTNVPTAFFQKIFLSEQHIALC